MQYKIVITDGPGAGRSFPLDAKKALSIGRGAASDTQIDDPHMSRVHCEVALKGDSVIVRDLKSASGTLVDGQTIESAILTTGQIIQAGETQFTLQVAGTPESAINAATMARGPVATGGDPNSLAKLVGEQLGNYQLTEILAVAKSGIVFVGKDVDKNRKVAVKVLTPNFTNSDEQRERFVRAMKTMLPLRHENIVRLYHAGKKGPYCWAAMEWIDGESLSQVIERVGIGNMLDWRDVWKVAMHVTRALQAAHAEQIIHRNVTPTNIIRRTADKACLLGDLMLAKALEGTFAQQVTQPGQLLGELPYQSPERTQFEADVDCRSDLYELGATLYALLTGIAPASGKSLVEIIKNVRTVEPKPPRDFQLSINENFADLVMRLLSKQPEQRYQTAAEVISNLERVGRYNSLLC